MAKKWTKDELKKLDECETDADVVQFAKLHGRSFESCVRKLLNLEREALAMWGSPESWRG